MSHSRYLTPQVESDLDRKMVFLAGPRQVGKTTLALSLTKDRLGYLNWDVPEHREQILARQLPAHQLWIFDEIHKWRSWRNYLKGIYDAKESSQRILVTGSARLDMYRYSGDSLQGRYHLLRLHPLSVSELGLTSQEDFEQLLLLGGFPEPFFSGSEREARRWSREYRNLLVREELTSLERVQDLGNLELLVMRLPDLVGSPLSINALREDLRLSHKTVATWLLMLERLLAIFRLPPLGAPNLRAVKKAQKHYHADWSLVDDDATRFENLVAAHLLKWVQYQQDAQGLDAELRYFRDNDGREVDFVVMDKRQPQWLIECKTRDREVDKNLRYLKGKFPDARAWQLSARGSRDYVTPEGIRVCPGLAFLRGLV